MALNKVLLTGRITKDLELRTTTSGESVLSFTIAVDDKYKKDNELVDNTQFVPCVIYGKSAQFLDSYGKKGGLVLVEGKWNNRSYQTKDGNQKFITECKVEKVDIFDWKEKPADKVETKPQEQASTIEDDYTDDLPF